jgi:Tfp pilus assembly protein PilO
MAEQVNITEWLAKAKEDPKLAAQPVIIVAALFFLGYKFLYAPVTKKLMLQERRTKKVEGQIKRVESAADNLDDLKLEIEEKKAEWKKTQQLCYKKSEMTKFLRRIRELAELAGIPVKSINPQSISPMKMGEISVEKLPVSIYFTGDIVTLGTFLRLIEKEEKITFLSLPSLSPNASGQFELELIPTTILISDELAEEK